MKPIVLATDGSPSAAEATLDAVELAKALGVALVVVSVEHVVVPSSWSYGYGDLLTELTKLERAHVEKTLAHAKAVAAEAGVACEIVPRRGTVPDEICRVAKQHDARLIVVGAHGWGSAGRLWHGSVSRAVLHQASCPVLVVRGGPESLAPEALLDETAFVT